MRRNDVGLDDHAGPMEGVAARRLHLAPFLREWRVQLALLAFAIMVGVLSLLGAGACYVGQSTPSALRFLELGRPPSGDEAFVAFPQEYALHSEEANDVIFLGDSVCFHGLDPVAFEKLTLLKAFNLGSFGYIGPVGYPIVSRTYFLNHPKPRAVVLCVTVLSFELDPEISGGSVPRRFSNAYAPLVGLSNTPFSTLARIGAKSARNWIRGSPDVRDLPLAGMESESYRSYQRRWTAARGYLSLRGPHGPAHRLVKFSEVAKIRDDWNVGIRRLADECSSFGVPLIIRFAPLSAELRDGRDYSPLERWVDRIKDWGPGIVVAGRTLEWCDPSLSWDRVHLNAAGVEKFVAVVARDVQGALAR